MSIVSLEKYLNESKTQSAVSRNGPSDASYLELTNRLLAAICRSVFVGERFTDLSEELEAIRKSLQIDPQQSVLSQQARQAEILLQKFQDRLRLDQQQVVADFKRVVDIVNETFTQITATSERSDDRFKQVEQGLSRAARMEDMTVLRGHLSKMLETVRKDGKTEEQQRRSLIENLSTKIRSVHETAASFTLPLLVRSEALEHLNAACVTAASGSAMYAAVFTFDSLHAIRARHGEEVANRILAAVGAGEIRSLAPNGEVFSWSPSALLLLWEHNDEVGSPSELIQHLKRPIEHRASVGSRTAVFNLSLRSLVTPVNGSLAEMTDALDRFTKS